MLVFPKAWRLVILLFWSASAVSVRSTLIKLLSGEIETGAMPKWQHHRGRSLLHVDVLPHVHPDWGVLHGALQLLVTLKNSYTSSDAAAVQQLIDSTGGYTSGYLPESTLLVLGNGSVAENTEQHPAVTWVGIVDPQYKLDPQWQHLLNLPGELQQHFVGNNLHTYSTAQLQLLDGIQQDSHPKHGGPRLAIAVSFPPTTDVVSKGSASRLHQRANPASAAVSDWSAALHRHFDGNVSLTEYGSQQLTVYSPPDLLHPVLQWLAHQPAVHWLAPRHQFKAANFESSAIIQSGQGAGSKDLNDAGLRPYWAAGINGNDQVVGMGDSGVDFNHCFFVDPAINLNLDSSWAQDPRFGFPVFNSTRHRKIRLYYAFGDRRDSNGHGTHCAGSAVGASQSPSRHQGMAPASKLAFWDLGRGGMESVSPPGDLSTDYYPITYAVGARIHSDSWGSTSTAYDELSAQVDLFSWVNKDFLPLFAAGNDGTLRGSTRASGERTVTSPGTAKNTITVGATESLFRSSNDAASYKVYDMTSVTASNGNSHAIRVVQGANVGGQVSNLRGSYALAYADPILACAPLTNSNNLKGAVVLLQRGSCTMAEKVLFAEQAGAAAAIVFDNQPGAYFELGPDGRNNPTIPAMAIPRRFGQTYVALLQSGEQVQVSFSSASPAANIFDNLAAYSSQGPTEDGRTKPDVIAPGTTESSHTGTTGCGTAIMQGTSMATPIVAGGAALVRQYLLEGYYPDGRSNSSRSHSPSGALVKALILGGATPLTGFESDTGLPIDPPPSTRQGYGRITLRNSLPLSTFTDRRRLQFVDSAPLTQGQVHRYCIASTGGPLTITLVWADWPALRSAQSKLVNDLDLVVRAAGFNGTALLGNGGGTGTGEADRLNNVEQVSMDELPAGDVAIEVTGYRLPNPRASTQPYSLVVLGAFDGVLASDYNPAGKGLSPRECSVGLVTITQGPQGLTNDKPVSFSFTTAQGGTSNLECQLSLTTSGRTSVESAWADCSGGSVTYSDIADGAYLFQVRLKGSPSIASRTFILDTEPPTVTLRSAPTPRSAQAVATADWNATDMSGVSFACMLAVTGGIANQGDVFDSRGRPVALNRWSSNCTAPQAYHWLLPGNWTLSINASDEAGNSPSAPYTVTWQVAFEPDVSHVRLTTGLLGLTNRSSANFTFIALQATASGMVSRQTTSFQCAFSNVSDGVMISNVDPTTQTAAWTTCSGAFSQSGIRDGKYLFMARTPPQSGRRLLATPSETYGISVFTVDTQPPNITMTSGPSLYTSKSTVDIAYTSNENGTQFTCALLPGTAVGPPGTGEPGNGNFTLCGSPQTFSSLADGWYTFWLSGIDAAGNVAPPQNRTFFVDTTAPQVDLQCPGALQANSFVITWNASDTNGAGIATTQCKMFAQQLKNGSTSNGDNIQWSNCGSPMRYSDMAEGRWVFMLQVTDNANNTAQVTPCMVVVDTTAPKVTIASGPSKTNVNPATATFVLQPDDGVYGSNVTSFQCQWNTITEGEYQQLKNSNQPPSAAGQYSMESTSWKNCSQTTVLGPSDLPTSGTWAFTARAIDTAGNVGEPAPLWVFKVDTTLPLPTQGGSSSDSALSLSILIAIIIGGATAAFIVLTFLITCCVRRFRKPLPPAPPSAVMFAPDPDMNAAIAASLLDANGNAPAGYLSGGQPVYIDPQGVMYAVGPDGTPYTVDPAMVHHAYPAALPPPNGYAPSVAAVPVMREMDPAMEAALQASLAESYSSHVAPGALQGTVVGNPVHSSLGDDEGYRAAVQASLQQQYISARQRMEEEQAMADMQQQQQQMDMVGARPRTPSQQCVEETDPEMLAAMAASLRDAEAEQAHLRSSVMYPHLHDADGHPSAPHYLHQDPSASFAAAVPYPNETQFTAMAYQPATEEHYGYYGMQHQHHQQQQRELADSALNPQYDPRYQMPEHYHYGNAQDTSYDMQSDPRYRMHVRTTSVEEYHHHYAADQGVQTPTPPPGHDAVGSGPQALSMQGDTMSPYYDRSRPSTAQAGNEGSVGISHHQPNQQASSR